MAQDNMNKYGLVGKNANQMTLLVNKIERRIGASVLPLPEGLRKDDWPNIIMEDSIVTFSRYFPYCITTLVRPNPMKDGWQFIDSELPEGTVILGVRDVDFQSYKIDPRLDRYGMNVFSQDFLAREYAVDDIGLTVTGNDLMSLFDLGVYVSWEYPNKIKLESVNGFPISQNRPFPIKLLIQHPGLWTISPTMMELFERLCVCDVSIAIWNVLKYYDNMDTAYATLSLQLDVLQERANERPDLIREMDEAHTTTANEYQPVIITV